MIESPVCIRRTGSVEEAELIVAWLDESGIDATIIGQDNPGVLAFGVTDSQGVAVFVPDAVTAERAAAALAEHDKERGRTTAIDAADIDVVCEDCGRMCSFDAEHVGSVQACPECGSFLDVPGGADDET